ncbi:hypothetical protein AOT83_04885 [Mycobacteroides sp. H001]|uniref:hypothetical protein n=1 Tax=Mycobacteroides TaxID=670516 RepID=UPI000713E528|nr:MULTISPECIES: hypothetical protein [Mycobacteroides]KRQ31319.1 hypothetical protein AOT86_01520 [Mycobacteroides sp. H072]KRQ35924.1 hypothetical protein AOT84_15590 [Mycobacteroides sp. H002]KRQ50538.1 hypothetical protein AOT85_13640 [Mycobacteroides sp. H054]KRQ72701.1 hypothetical protein AOT83_04885 [Mycobacteroides sp. H001]OHU43067.1 hypothetical protein BKG79_03595 [Mycobacteroides chelonae]
MSANAADEAQDPSTLDGNYANDAASTAKTIIGLVTTLVGYAAVISALMLYFGYIRTRDLYLFFGVDVGALHLSATDYNLRAAQLFFHPLVWITLAVVAFYALTVGAVYIERETVGKFRTGFRCTLALATLVAAIYAICGLLGVGNGKRAAIALGLSAALAIVQYKMYRSGRKTSRSTEMVMTGATALLIGAAAFWWTTIYAQDEGLKAARAYACDNAGRGIIIYSKNQLMLEGFADLSLPGAPVDNQYPWRYTYVGYKVLVYANDRWFLYRQPWSQHTYTAILPADDDSIMVRLLGDKPVGGSGSQPSSDMSEDRDGVPLPSC